jgi:hypothetical protein
MYRHIPHKKERKDVIGPVCALCIQSHFCGERIFKKIVFFQSFSLRTTPMKMEKTECSETPAREIQTSGQSPKRKNKTFIKRGKF